ncbi:MAG: EAL domain-containing protein [Acetobacteraceae bacterium]|nr:EAL domain-containing protein [Acetobacteraceae bacterium]
MRAVLSVGPECAALACLLALIWWGIWVTLQTQHDSALDGAARDTTNLTHAFEENTQRIVAGADQVLLSLRAAYGRDGSGFDLRSWAKREISPDWLTAQIAIIDANGMSVASTASRQSVSIADREHFTAQRDSTRDDLFISRPVLGRSSGRWTIQLTRKILSSQGEFAGVAVLSVDCYQLSGFYQSLDVQQGFIALVGLDGVVRARGPVAEGAIGSRMERDGPAAEIFRQPHGTVRVPSRAGQLTVSYRRLSTYPLIVTVGFADKPVLSLYRRMRLGLLWSGSLATLALLLLGTVWIRVRNRSIAFKEALELTLESMNQGLVMVDGDDRVRVLNGRALELLGLPASMLHDLRERSSRDADMGQQRLLLSALQEELAPRLARPDEGGEDGRVLECNTSPIAGGGAVHLVTDVTARHAANRRIRHMALHDSLTGLGNRALLNEELDAMLAACAASGERFAVLSLGLNGFKRVNDSLGQELGDQLLVAVAERLRARARNEDVLTRSAGGEFAILSRFSGDASALGAVTGSLLGIFDDPFLISGQEFRLRASIGVATWPEHGVSHADLLRNADLALFAAMAENGTPVKVFEPAMAQRVQDRLQLEQQLREAIDADQLSVEYQPQFRASSLEVVGFEALVRWNHPTRGKIPPGVFIPLAEETGLVIPLGRRILEQACRTALQWPEPIRIGVNLSPVQFRDPQLPAMISDVLRATGLPVSRLELEVTEGVLIADEEQALQVLSSLRQLGVGLALDDFGTGYASLSYLRKFPFERIKLDRSFVQAQVLEDRSRHILQSILELSRKLGLGVIAEGVETRTQLHLLRQQGCQEIQGFLVGKPMSARDAAQMIGPPASERSRSEGMSRPKLAPQAEPVGTSATLTHSASTR